MKDGTGAGEPADVSRQELYDTYVNFYREPGTEAGPCRDARLAEKATRYLLREAQPRSAFTVFPFYQAVSEGPDALRADCRKHLCAFIKATELLETLCVNLFLQPWKKEIRTLKTYTGPFVYCLLPVFTSSTINSVLASIGYLPHADAPSEFRLSDDANSDRGMQVGFELLLARMECHRLLDLWDKDQLGPQEWLEMLQSRVCSRKPEEPTGKKTAEPKEEEKMKKEGTERKEVPEYVDTRPAVQPQPKPRRCHTPNTDKSIMEMQRTYPDLVFRGRPLVTDKSQQGNSSRSSNKGRTAGDDSKGAEPSKRDVPKGTRAAAPAVGGKADEAFGDGAAPQGDAASSSTDGSRVDELSGPQAISLHITLRSGVSAEKSQKPGDPQPPAEPLCWTQQQQQPPADALNRSLKAEPPSLSSVDEEQELRQLAQRMGQLHVSDTREEVKRKDGPKKGGENVNKDKSKKWRKPRTEGDAEEQSLRKPVMETGAALSHEPSRCSRPPHYDHAAVKEQKQVHHPSLVSVAPADCESCRRGDGPAQQDGHDPEREEQVAQSFILI